MGLLDRFLGAKPAPVQPIHVETRAELDALLGDGGKPVLLYVWGSGCAPCSRMESVVVDVAGRHAAKVRLAEVNRDVARELLASLEVQATPTVIVFDGPDEIGRVSGFRPSTWFDEMIAAEL